KGEYEKLFLGDTERFELIRLISQHGLDYRKIREAYIKFMGEYGFESATEDLDQIATVSSVALGKALKNGDLSTMRTALVALKNVVSKDGSYWKFVAKQLLENI